MAVPVVGSGLVCALLSDYEPRGSDSVSVSVKQARFVSETQGAAIGLGSGLLGIRAGIT